MQRDVVHVSNEHALHQQLGLGGWRIWAKAEQAQKPTTLLLMMVVTCCMHFSSNLLQYLSCDAQGFLKNSETQPIAFSRLKKESPDHKF